jgi:sirohydrochlorin cobaltochelatase
MGTRLESKGWLPAVGSGRRRLGGDPPPAEHALVTDRERRDRLWQTFCSSLEGGLLLVGHGTRLPSGNAQLRELAAKMRQLLPGVPLVDCFLELSDPDIPAAISQMREMGLRSVLCVPVLLFSAGHARRDIPEAVQKSVRQQRMRLVGQSAPLGLNRAALQLSKLRFEQALELQGSVAKQDDRRISHSDAQRLEIGLAMVGRGAGERSALQMMRSFTQMRTELTPVGWSETGFFVGGEPTVESLLERAAQSACRRLVVQPHLLFDGKLFQELRERVGQWQQREPGRWLLAEPLGSDHALAEALIDLAAERLQRSLRRWFWSPSRWLG